MTYIAPNARALATLKNSATTQSLVSQIYYFNILFYLLPVLFFYLILKPTTALHLGDEYAALMVQNLLDIIANLYFLKIIGIMSLYNALLTICTSSIAASHTQDITESQKNICDCSRSEKLQQLLKGSLYYMSNNIFAHLFGIFTHPFIALPLKIITQGQGFIDGALANKGACPQHRRAWFSKHNLFALGVGTSFVVTQYLSEQMFSAIIDINSLNFLSTYIIQDSLSYLIWLSFMYNIYFSPTLVSLSDEYACDFFLLNNNIVDILYSYFRPKIEFTVNNLDKMTTRKYYLPGFIKNIFSMDKLLTSPPMQLFLAQSQASLSVATMWLKRLDSFSFMITDSEWLISRERLKFILSNWIPKTAVNLIFMAVTRGYLSESKVTWLEQQIATAKLNPTENYSSMRLIRFLINKGAQHVQRLHRRYCHEQDIRSFEVVTAPTHSESTASLSSPCSELSSPTAIVEESDEWNLIWGLNEIQVVQPRLNRLNGLEGLRMYGRATNVTSSIIDNHFPTDTAPTTYATALSPSKTR